MATIIDVTGTLVDGSDEPTAGSIICQLLSTADGSPGLGMLDGGGVIVRDVKVDVDDTGVFALGLQANDDPDMEIEETRWRVTLQARASTAARRVVILDVPKDAPGGTISIEDCVVDLPDLSAAWRPSELDAHVSDPTAAHAASAISASPTGHEHLSGTDVQAQLDAADDALSAHEDLTSTAHGGVVLQATKGQPAGVAELDGDGLVPSHQIRPEFINNVYPVEDLTEMLAIPDPELNDVAMVAEISKTYIYRGAPSDEGNWMLWPTPPDAVLSVAGKIGVVSLAGEDITSGTIADERIASTITRDTELTAGLAPKADTTTVNAALDLKADLIDGIVDLQQLPPAYRPIYVVSESDYDPQLVQLGELWIIVDDADAEEGMPTRAIAWLDMTLGDFEALDSPQDNVLYAITGVS